MGVNHKSEKLPHPQFGRGGSPPPHITTGTDISWCEFTMWKFTMISISAWPGPSPHITALIEMEVNSQFENSQSIVRWQGKGGLLPLPSLGVGGPPTPPAHIMGVGLLNPIFRYQRGRGKGSWNLKANSSWIWRCGGFGDVVAHW